MYITDFLQKYKKDLQTRVDDISISLTSGSASDIGHYTAYVAKVGPLAYKDIDKFGEEGAWCKEGDWVCIGRYAGSRFQIEGGEVRIINDDEVIATIVDPDDIKTYGA